MAERKVLIAGASGLVGYAVSRHLAARGGCEVVAVSRRMPLQADGIRHVAVDLTDRDRCAEVFGEMRGITHLVYAAVHERPGLVAGWREEEQIRTNETMLRNLFEPLERASGSTLRHVSLLQGTKAYGAHVRPIEIPAREDRSEHRGHPNFYWRQEDYIREKQAGRDWHWTILRPQIVFGMSTGSAMNLIPAIGAYGAILREQGRPLLYPGGPGNVLEAVDAELLARAIDWAGGAPEAADRAFNVTNGDVFIWRGVWPAIAEALGMEPGPDKPLSLGECMPQYGPEWDEIRHKYDLAAPPLADFVGKGFEYADFCMGSGARSEAPPPAIVSTIRLRRAGFTEVMDTEDMLVKWIRAFQRERLLPPA